MCKKFIKVCHTLIIGSSMYRIRSDNGKNEVGTVRAMELVHMQEDVNKLIDLAHHIKNLIQSTNRQDINEVNEALSEIYVFADLIEALAKVVSDKRDILGIITDAEYMTKVMK
ncbi:hypothetical protein [Sulfolobus polyhedral virus 1]|uniref:Uncharacterized protein n=1 Tax=Sulfolobus polyhedral virus 1 TaxID=1982658 RepID=A0A1W6I156_SPV1|nr:hypothetical protein DT302_gp17 [Sulfolobus polyhedral virus 1]ARM37799.1 hypothetical protein [Sulfolobus polyhedral virus 1]